MWIDTHAHLAELCESEFLLNLDNAKNAGVGGIINIGTNITESKNAIKQAKIIAPVKTFAVVGIAVPESFDYCGNFEWVAELENLAKDESVVAIGETGLDFAGKEDYPPIETQRTVFEKHIEIAKKLNKPIVIHSRMAEEKVLEMLISAGIKKAVFHCFTGNAETAKKITDAGFFVSFSGIVTFKRGVLDETVKSVLQDRIFVETDAPWLAPVPFRGKTNEPANVKIVGEKIASILEIDAEKLAEQTKNNTEKFFDVKF